MRADLVVILEPRAGRITQLRKRSKVLHVEELVADAGVKRFDPGILRRLAGIDEMQQHVVIDGSIALATFSGPL